MSRDRRTYRAVVLVLGIFGSSVSTGCLRSPLLRPSDVPDPGPAVSKDTASANTSALPSRSDSRAATDGGDKAAAPASTSAASALRESAAMVPFDVQSVPKPSAPAEPAGRPEAPGTQQPGPQPTPLLDAAIERVVAIRQEQVESLEPEAALAKPDHPASKSPTPPSPVVGAARPVAKAPEPAQPTVHEAPGPLVGPTLIERDQSAPPPLAPPRDADEGAPRLLTGPPFQPVSTAGAASAPNSEPEAPPRESAVTADVGLERASRDDDGPLGIAKLRLCRKVQGFGSFEPLGESEVKAGLRFLVYCEMNGMKYEAKDASFVSRLSSKLEVISASTGTIEWTRELGPAEDVCGSPRHDFYVVYRVDTPATLAPGSYRIHLTQTDLIAGRTTSAELSFKIVP